MSKILVITDSDSDVHEGSLYYLLLSTHKIFHNIFLKLHINPNYLTLCFWL